MTRKRIFEQPTPEPSKRARPNSPPPKRPYISGELTKLAVPPPLPVLANKQDPSITTVSGGRSSTLSGAKIGGKSKDLDRVGKHRRNRRNHNSADANEGEEMFITRKGMGMGGYLKAGIAAFLERGQKTLTLHAMGAAIPMALTLALAIQSAIPGGSKTGTDTMPGALGTIKMKIWTGTVDVFDQITPEDEELDITIQTRKKSSVRIKLELDIPPRRV